VDCLALLVAIAFHRGLDILIEVCRMRCGFSLSDANDIIGALQNASGVHVSSEVPRKATSLLVNVSLARPHIHGATP
jgi:hypothetical protein